MAMMSDVLANQQGKSKKKEAEWKDFCKDVFDQYLVEDNLYSFDDSMRGRNMSHDSTLLFGSSNPSDQSICTTNTSPMPPHRPSASTLHRHSAMAPTLKDSEARQPRVQPPPHFWNRTLKTLERTAVETEQKMNRLRAVKSHPDFLSLGGFPSPPAIPSPSPFPPLSVPRQRSRAIGGSASNKTQSSNRSVSRGRTSARVSKLPTTIHPSATTRKRSVSPTKMLHQSRHRSGFHDAFADHVATDTVSVWSSNRPLSPSPATRYVPEEYVHARRYQVPTQIPPSYLSYDEPISPLTQTLQHAHINPGYDMHMAQPVAQLHDQNMAIYAPSNNYFVGTTNTSNAVPAATTVAPDLTPIFPAPESSAMPSKMQSFDFGFDEPAELDYWDRTVDVDAPVAEYAVMSFPTTPSVQRFHHPNPPMSTFSNPYVQSNVIPEYDTSTSAYIAQLPSSDDFTYEPRIVSPKRRIVAKVSDPPVTPSRRRSESPPPPATEPRSRQNNRSQSRSRATSRHRRAKSIHTAPRTMQSLDRGGFVNYTPQDSGKLLSGVAPSGSSKTKARREKEAADRRRILSQAAVKAVVDAGGDLNALSAAGLLL